MRFRWTLLVILVTAPLAGQQTGPVQIEVAPANQSINPATQQQYSAQRSFLGGLGKPTGAIDITNFVWLSSDESVATVDPRTGLATAMNPGRTQIIATCGPFRNSVLLTVNGPFCGNGIRDGADQCDDGAHVNLDGCNASCRFEQSQRMNSISMAFMPDTTCTQNRLGSAFPNAGVQAQLNNAITNSVNSGATNSLLTMLGITDLTGTNEASFQVGVLFGTPVAGAGYDGSSDLDWWYMVDPSTIDGNRVPFRQLPASIAAHSLSAVPGGSNPFGIISFPFDTGSGVQNFTMTNTVIKATTGAPSTPLTSSNQGPPGHLASENLDPALQSYGTMSGGSVCGGISASSLATVPAPAQLQLGGPTACDQGYDATHSLLDVLVSGCTILGALTVIKPTQPDTSDPSLAQQPVGSGPPYTFVTDSTHHIITCKDSQGVTAPPSRLQVCLHDAAYSSYFKFSSDRVILK